MRGLALIPIVALAAMLGTVPHLQDVYVSIGHVIEHGHHCTVFSVGGGLWLGAAHCKGINQMNGEELLEVKIDPVKDLRLLRGPIVTPLLIAKSEPELGEPVTIWGWTDGLGELMGFESDVKPLVFFGRAQMINVEIRLEEDGPKQPKNLFHEGGGPGMSGGPILNAKGEVVGVAEALVINPSISAISPTVKAIRKFLELK